jgi:hypothetical protein
MSFGAHITTITGVDYQKVSEQIIEQEYVFKKGYGFRVYPKTEECDNLKRLIESMANNVLPIKVDLVDIWAVVTNKGESVSYHSHHSNTHMQPEEYWSGVIYTASDEDSAELVLHSFAFNRVESMTRIKPEVGKAVFFNSFVPHFTTMHESNRPRVAVSFNLKPKHPNITEIPDMSVYGGNNE